MSGGEWSHYSILFTPSSLGAQNKSPLNRSNKAGLRKIAKQVHVVVISLSPVLWNQSLGQWHSILTLEASGTGANMF